MRLLLRLLAPLLGLALAAAGLLLMIEVVAAWVRPGAGSGLLMPWPQWRDTLQSLSWDEFPVPAIAITVAVLGLLLLLVGLLARRSDIVLDPPAPEITVTTSPRVLARVVGRRVRAGEDVARAAVTASRRRVAVTAEGWSDPDQQLRASVETRVNELLDELPLAHRPRVTVRVAERGGPR
jgi:Family of unknown function (DUF6286)